MWGIDLSRYRKHLRPMLIVRSALGNRHAGNDTGVVALEFALAIPLFLYLCLSVAEVGATALTQTTLDNAVTTVADAISDGTWDTASGALSPAEVRTRICRDARPALVSQTTCMETLMVGLSGMTGAAPLPSAISGGAVNPAAFSSGTIESSDIILVRAALPAPRLSPLWRPGLANLADGGHLVVSTAVALPAASAGGRP